MSTIKQKLLQKFKIYFKRIFITLCKHGEFMTKLSQKLDKSRKKSKITINKIFTNAGLFLFTHNKKIKTLSRVRNVEYGKDKRQKFDIYAPKFENMFPVIFYFHGGAWSAGDKYGNTMFCQKLAKQGYIVCNVNYRLMPKISVIDCVVDCMEAIRYFAKNYEQIFKKQKISALPYFENTFLVGDSAGAHLAGLIAGICSKNKKELPVNISALGLYYGVFDFEHLDNDPSPIMQSLNNYWLINEKNPAELYKKISVTNYVTNNFPPCFLTSGAIDKLHFQTETFVDVLKKNDVKMDYLNFGKSRLDAEHAFLNASFLASSKEAFDRLTKFFEKYKKNNEYEKK